MNGRAATAASPGQSIYHVQKDKVTLLAHLVRFVFAVLKVTVMNGIHRTLTEYTAGLACALSKELANQFLVGYLRFSQRDRRILSSCRPLMIALPNLFSCLFLVKIFRLDYNGRSMTGHRNSNSKFQRSLSIISCAL